MHSFGCLYQQGEKNCTEESRLGIKGVEGKKQERKVHQRKICPVVKNFCNRSSGRNFLLNSGASSDGGHSWAMCNIGKRGAYSTESGRRLARLKSRRV